MLSKAKKIDIVIIPISRDLQSLYRSMNSVVEFSSRKALGSPIAFKATMAAVDFMASGSWLASCKQLVGDDVVLKIVSL